MLKVLTKELCVVGVYILEFVYHICTQLVDKAMSKKESDLTLKRAIINLSRESQYRCTRFVGA
jgi:hypothetical protein